VRAAAGRVDETSRSRRVERGADVNAMNHMGRTPLM
jgi:hypothetical protein